MESRVLGRRNTAREAGHPASAAGLARTRVALLTLPSATALLNRLEQLGRLDWFVKEAGPFEGRALLAALVEAGQDDDRNAGQFGGVLQFLAEGPAVHDWHAQVEQDQVRPVRR